MPSEQETNLRRLRTVVLATAVIVVGFICWWLYQGAGYFRDEMAYNSAFGPRKLPRLPLPPDTVPRNGMGYDAVQLGLAPLQVTYAPAYAAALYANNCAFCHAASGRGDTAIGFEYDPRPPDFNQVVPHRSDGQLFAALSDGMTTPELDTQPPLGPDWHAYRLYLGESDRRQLVDFLRSRFGSGRQPTEPPATTIASPAYGIVGNPPARPHISHP